MPSVNLLNMKLVKAIVYFISMTLGTLLVAAVFAPSEYTVQRDMEVKVKKEQVYNALIDLHNWSKWDAWYSMDSLQTRSFKGSQFNLPYSMEWKSKNEDLGNGSTSIIKTIPNEQVTYRTVLENGGWDLILEGSVAVEEHHGATKVIWSATSNLPYPFKFAHFFMEKMTAKDYEASLEGLRSYTEALSRASFFDQATSP